VKYEQNLRAPYIQLYMAPHTLRVMRLTREQRGMLDEVRCELWSVDGTRMLRADLMARLRIKPNSKDERTFEALVSHRILDQDDDVISDPVLITAWNTMLDRSRKNSANASRPRKAPSVTPTPAREVDPEDF
jgi:hypothetical protein